jgi:hypothetical protein
MALMAIAPVEAQVRWDRRARRPSEVRWAGHQLRVVGLAAVRDERAAYPMERGPRVTYLLATSDGQASLVFDGRRRRWFVEAVEAAEAA